MRLHGGEKNITKLTRIDITEWTRIDITKRTRIDITKWTNNGYSGNGRERIADSKPQVGRMSVWCGIIKPH